MNNLLIARFFNVFNFLLNRLLYCIFLTSLYTPFLFSILYKRKSHKYDTCSLFACDKMSLKYMCLEDLFKLFNLNLLINLNLISHIFKSDLSNYINVSNSHIPPFIMRVCKKTIMKFCMTKCR